MADVQRRPILSNRVHRLVTIIYHSRESYKKFKRLGCNTIVDVRLILIYLCYSVIRIEYNLGLYINE